MNKPVIPPMPKKTVLEAMKRKSLERWATKLHAERNAAEAERDAIIGLIQKLYDEAVRAVDEAEFTPGEFDLVDHKRLLGELLDAVKK